MTRWTSRWMIRHPDIDQTREAEDRAEALDIAAEWIKEDGVPHLEIWQMVDLYIPNPDMDKAEQAATEETTMQWRTGRRNGRTIYLQAGAEPSDSDKMIGVMDTDRAATEAVEAVNSCGDPGRT